MVEKESSPQDLSKLVEQSVSTLQEVDRRLQAVRSDLANLIQKASQLGLQGPIPGVPGFAGQEPFGRQLPMMPGLGAPFGFGAPVPPLPPQVPMGSPGAQAFPQGFPPGAFAPPPFGAAPPGFQGFGPQGPPPRNVRELQNLPPSPRVPSVDMVDQGEEFVIQVELPGVKRDDLDIMVSERVVTVTGQARPGITEGALLLGERGPITYRRTLPLPTDVHTTQSKANFKDGILTLTVPKKQPTEAPRKVDVAYG